MHPRNWAPQQVIHLQVLDPIQNTPANGPGFPPRSTLFADTSKDRIGRVHIKVQQGRLAVSACASVHGRHPWRVPWAVVRPRRPGLHGMPHGRRIFRIACHGSRARRPGIPISLRGLDRSVLRARRVFRRNILVSIEHRAGVSAIVRGARLSAVGLNGELPRAHGCVVRSLHAAASM